PSRCKCTAQPSRFPSARAASPHASSSRRMEPSDDEGRSRAIAARRAAPQQSKSKLEEPVLSTSTPQQIQPPRGMNDVLPSESAAWQHLENIARELFEAYAYREIRVPIVEHTALFKRSIGEFTDIVQKEMFTFVDPGGDSL